MPTFASLVTRPVRAVRAWLRDLVLGDVYERIEHLERRLPERMDRVEDRLAARIEKVEAVAAQSRFLPDLENRIVQLARRSAAPEPPGPPRALSREGALRVGMVTVWGSRGGVAGYSRFLIDAVSPKAVDWTVLAEESSAPLVAPDDARVVRCWRTRRRDDLRRLLHEVERRDLHVVHFQFHDGYFEHTALAEAISTTKRQGRRVVVTFHKTRDVKEDGRVRSLADIADALAAADLLLVHTDEDRVRFGQWGLGANVRVLAHGAVQFPIRDREQVRTQLGLTAQPIIATFGFMGPRKRLLELIEATDLVRRTHPGAMLLALAALGSGRPSHDYYCSSVMRLTELRLHDRVRIVTRFLAPDEIAVALQASDVVVLPYREEGESCSGAARFALASGRPVLVSRSSMFFDIAAETHQLDAPTPDGIARGIEQVIGDSSRAEDLVRRARERCQRDAWPNIGRAYAQLLRDLSRD